MCFRVGSDLLFLLQKKGSGGPWEPFEKAKGLRQHEGHAYQEDPGWEKGNINFSLWLMYQLFVSSVLRLYVSLHSVSMFNVLPGPQSDQETDLQEGWEVPQGVQADVQAWDPPESHCSQSGKLLCASWAQIGLCHQDQGVSSVIKWGQNCPACQAHQLHLHGLLDLIETLCSCCIYVLLKQYSFSCLLGVLWCLLTGWKFPFPRCYRIPTLLVLDEHNSKSFAASVAVSVMLMLLKTLYWVIDESCIHTVMDNAALNQ